MFGVNERRRTATLLHFCNDVKGEGRLARAFRTVDLDHPAARQTAYAERKIQSERAGGHRLDLNHLALGAQFHHCAFAERAIELRKRCFERLLLV